MQEVIDKIIQFRDERNWGQFHNPKDIAISLSIESSELLECFQWKNNQEIEELLNTNYKIKIQEEIADIEIYLLLLCNQLDIDIKEAVMDKLEKNKLKYPIDKSKGNAKKYTQL